MLPLFVLLSLSAHLVGADARNDTIVHGWVEEPERRGTMSLIYSCLATVILCTWSVLHVDVPKHHGRWYVSLLFVVQWRSYVFQCRD